MRRSMLVGAAAASLAVAACGTEPGVHGNEAGHGDHVMANDPANPFAEAEMRMRERMAGVQGAELSEIWIRKMIEHHRGGVEMSEILLAQGGDAAVLEQARQTLEAQQREIAELEAMLAGEQARGPDGSENRFAEVEARMHETMMAARGETPSETWLRKMIEHHRGAIEMSNLVIQQNGRPDVLRRARRTVDAQAREIQALERILRGEAAAAAAPAAAPTPEARPPGSPQPAREPAARSETIRAAPGDAPAPKAAQPNQSADPHANHSEHDHHDH